MLHIPSDFTKPTSGGTNYSQKARTAWWWLCKRRRNV